MDYELTRDDFEENLVETLQGHGVAVCKGYIDDFSLIKEEAEKIIEKTSDPCSYYEKTINTDYVGSFDFIDEHEVKND